jgi:hypothetical protein
MFVYMEKNQKKSSSSSTFERLTRFPFAGRICRRRTL